MQNKQKLTRPFERKVRFTQAENEFIKAKVDASPFNNFQNFARILLLTGEIKTTDYSALNTLNFEVNKIGNNINQMAKLAHQFDEISGADIEELTQELVKLRELVAERFKSEIKRERRSRNGLH